MPIELDDLSIGYIFDFRANIFLKLRRQGWSGKGGRGRARSHFNKGGEINVVPNINLS